MITINAAFQDTKDIKEVKELKDELDKTLLTLPNLDKADLSFIKKALLEDKQKLEQIKQAFESNKTLVIIKRTRERDGKTLRKNIFSSLEKTLDLNFSVLRDTKTGKLYALLEGRGPFKYIEKNLELGKALGFGGFSTVKPGVNLEDFSVKAVKITRIKHRLLSDEKKLSALGHHSEAIARHVVAMKSHLEAMVKSEPEIGYAMGLTIGEAQSSTTHYNIQELIKGKPLIRCLLNNEISEVSEKLNIAFGIATALNDLHEREYLYLDMRPDNCMYDKETGKITIVDFGTTRKAKKENDVLTAETLTFMGTNGYRDPSIRSYFTFIDGDEVYCFNSYSDVYSLGITLSHVFLHTNKEAMPTFFGINENSLYRLIIMMRQENNSSYQSRPSLAQVIDCLLENATQYVLHCLKNPKELGELRNLVKTTLFSALIKRSPGILISGVSSITEEQWGKEAVEIVLSNSEFLQCLDKKATVLEKAKIKGLCQDTHTKQPLIKKFELKKEQDEQKRAAQTIQSSTLDSKSEEPKRPS